MSSNGAFIFQLSVGDQILLRNNQYGTFATAALTVYYWTLTIGWEMEVFWKGRLTGASTLFMLNRYVGLLYRILNAGQSVAPMTDKSCSILSPTLDILNQVLSLISAVFTSLRVFALSRKSWFLALACFGISLVPIVLQLLLTHATLGWVVLGPGWGCVGIDNPHASFFYTERFAVSTFSTTVLSVLATNGLLIYRTWVAIAPLGGIRSVNLGKASLLHVFFRNEILYFVIIIAVNVVMFSGQIVAFTDPTGPNYTFVGGISDAVSSILVSQFLLELQAVENQTRAGGSHLSSTDSHISSVAFDRVVGSLGRASFLPEGDGDEVEDINDVEGVDDSVEHRGSSNLVEES